MSSFGTDAHCEKVTSNEIHARTRLNTQTVSVSTPPDTQDAGVPTPDGTQKVGDLWFVADSSVAANNGVWLWDGSWRQVATKD